MRVEGIAGDGYEKLAEMLEASIADGSDVGASVAVTVEGETVVDVWGGWADVDRTKPWAMDTITNVWSTTKTMTALAALVCIERDLIDPDAPVSHYWPEFAAAGKESVLVRHLLSHTSGVSGWEQPITVEDIYDHEAAVARLAGQAPWWEPGSASGYHALNQGHLVGEVVRRVTGASLGQFFASEIAEPLGVDFHIGLDAGDDHRVSDVIPPPPLPIDMDALDPDSVMFKTFTGPAPEAQVANTEAWRRAEIGAANGHGNARAVARALAVIANDGTLDGVDLLSPRTIARIFEVQSDGSDLVLGAPLRFGLGFGLPSESTPYLPDRRVCYWGGWGGSVAVADVDRRTTVSYVMNRMEGGLLGDNRGQDIVRAALATPS